MVFSDLFFLFVFLPTFALSYLAAHWIDKLLSSEATRPNRIVENAVLVVFSLIFYAWGEPVYVFLMLFCVLLNYLAGLGIGHTQGTARKWALAGGLAGNILILSAFKYLSFFAQQLSALGIPVAAPKIALPIGISFYTFSRFPTSSMSIARRPPCNATSAICYSISRCSHNSSQVLLCAITQ